MTSPPNNNNNNDKVLAESHKSIDKESRFAAWSVKKKPQTYSLILSCVLQYITLKTLVLTLNFELYNNNKNNLAKTTRPVLYSKFIGLH